MFSNKYKPNKQNQKNCKVNEGNIFVQREEKKT